MAQNEQDLSTRRNAFQFLTAFDQPRAINYLLSQVPADVGTMLFARYCDLPRLP